MDMIGKIRRLHSRGKKSVREIARTTGLSRNTVSKWLQGEVDAPPKYRRGEQPCKLTAFHEVLRQALKIDARRPRVERRTARALYVEIKAAGYDGGYTRVTDFVRAWRQAEGAGGAVNAFVPLAFAMGEAFQFDWSEEAFVVGGIYYRMQVSHMKLCASRAFWLVAYPSQGHEMLFDDHTRSFAALGGIARRGIYDLRVDRRGQGQQGQGSCRQRALRRDVRALPVRPRLLQRRLGLGEGGRGEERAGQPPADLDRRAQAALRLLQYACRRGHSALYLRVPRLADELRMLHGNGGFSRWLATVARTEVLVLDDWGMAALDGPTRSDLMEIIDDRAGIRATIVTSQLPIEHWHAWIGDATIADAILDRLLSRSQRLLLKGKSLRPPKAGAMATAGDEPTPVDAGPGKPQ